MTQHESRPLGKAERTKRMIANEARGSLKRNGWRVTRAQIAKLSGVSRSTVINHFPTLKSLVREVYSDEITALDVATATALSEMQSAKTNEDRRRVLSQFIADVASTFASRATLARAFLPLMDDPWDPTERKAPKPQGPTFDTLSRDFAILLLAYWKDQATPSRVHDAPTTARYHIRAMICAAIQKGARIDIADPVRDHLKLT